MAYVSDNFLFRSLSDSEEESFRLYARHNDPKKGEPWEILHPVCREEWIKRGLKEEDFK